MTIKNFEQALFFDCEATGLHAQTTELIEVGIVSKDGVLLVERAKPSTPLPSFITKLTGIRDSDLESAQTERDLILKVHDKLRGARALGGYFIHLDIEYLRNAYSRARLTEEFAEIEKIPCVCAKTLARVVELNLPEDFSLTDLCVKIGVPTGTEHNACEDAKMAMLAAEKMASLLGATSLDMLIALQGPYVCSPWERPNMSHEQKLQSRQRWQDFVESTKRV